MAILRLTWPHGINVDLDDPNTPRATIEESIVDALAHAKPFSIQTSSKTVLVPAELLRVALIEVTD